MEARRLTTVYTITKKKHEHFLHQEMNVLINIRKFLLPPECPAVSYLARSLSQLIYYAVCLHGAEMLQTRDGKKPHARRKWI